MGRIDPRSAVRRRGGLQARAITPVLAAALLLAAAAPAAAAAAIEAPAEVAEVVVTATRQAQPLARAPVSVSAFTPDRIEALNIRSPADLARATPGVRFNPLDNSIAIRGVESDAGAGTTGIYIDDTPIQIRAVGTNPMNAQPAVFDLQRIEVIRGPQGVLFGAGAQGGAVRYITRAPSLTTRQFRLEAQATATDGGGPGQELGFAAGAPLIDGVLAVRGAVWTRHEGGYVERVDAASGAVVDGFANRTDWLVGRLSARWAASERLTLTPSLDFQSRRANDTSGWWEGLSDPDAGVFRNGNPVRLPDDDRFVLAAVKGEYAGDGFSVTANAAWFDRRQETAYDGSIYTLSYLQTLTGFPLLTPTGIIPSLAGYAAPAPIINRQQDFTQELRIQSTDPDARWRWVAGVFYGRNRQQNLETIIDPAFDALHLALFGQDSLGYYGFAMLPGDVSYVGEFRTLDAQLAVFGEIEWRATARLKLSAGLRAARSEFSFTNAQDGPFNAPGPSGGAGAQGEWPVTPKLGLSFQASDQTMVYAALAKGYRIGGANVPLPMIYCGKALAALGLSGTPATYDSDTVWSAEAGAKSRSADGRLQVAASVFHLRWSDIQQSIYMPACGFSFTANLGEAQSTGFDLEGQARLTESVSLNLAVGYVKAAYASRSILSPVARRSAAEDGDALPGSPWKLAVGVAWDRDIAGLPAFVRADYEYASAEPDGPEQNPATQQYDRRIPVGPAVSVVMARAGIEVGDWKISAFVDNALNARPQLSRSHEDQGTRLFVGTTLRPRTVGVATSVSF